MAEKPPEGEAGGAKEGPAGTAAVSLWRGVVPLALAVALGLVLVYVLPYLARPLELLVVAVTLAEALAPVVGWLSRWLRPILAIAVVYAALALVAVVVGWLIVPPLVDQAQTLIARAPTFLAQAQAFVDRWDRVTGGRLAGLLETLPGRIGAGLVRVPLQLAGALFDALLVIFFSIYWLAGAPRIEGFALSLLRPRYRAQAALVLHQIGLNMGGYVRGAVINAVIMGVLAWLGLSVIGVPFAVVLGALTMLGELVPILGSVIVGTIVTLIALTRSLQLALGAAALFTALVQIEGHLLTPNIMRRQTNVPQTLVLFAIVVGGGAGGLLGVIVSVPIAAAVRVLVLEVVAPWERRLARAEPPS